MNILLFGATGMVGDDVLRWLIASPKVSRVVAVSRKPLSMQHNRKGNMTVGPWESVPAAPDESIGGVPTRFESSNLEMTAISGGLR